MSKNLVKNRLQLAASELQLKIFFLREGDPESGELRAALCPGRLEAVVEQPLVALRPLHPTQL